MSPVNHFLRKILSILAVPASAALSICSFGQVQELNVPNAAFVPATFTAKWLTHPDLNSNEAAVILFRRSFDLPGKPDRFIINVSGDNKYTLFVNGRKICFGPQLSDIRHWRYETVDIGPYLRAGRNVLAAEVVNFGPDRFFGMQSYRTAFFLNGLDAGGSEALVHTTAQSGWKVYRNRAIHAKEVRWRSQPRDIIGGFYAANPTDSLVVAAYPWGWELPVFDDAAWKPAVFCENAGAFGGGFGWLLEPRNVPLQIQSVERLTRVAKAAGATVDAAFLQGRQPLVVPANTTVTLLIDHTKLTIGYPQLRFSGGKEAQVRIGYAENLFVGDTPRKGNRNELEGKRFLGMKDVIVADGSADRTFQPSWLRTFRFIQLEIKTKQEPMTISDFFNLYTTTSISIKARFTANQPEYERIFDLSRRTNELCTQDYFLGDAYYETMQYLGDGKVQAMAWLALSGNDRHVRNALQQFHYSRLPDGNLTSCYPLRATFVHPTYSVIWIDMLYDYLLYSGDKAYIRQFTAGIRQTLAMFDDLIQPGGLAGKTRWDYFIDWYSKSQRGGLAPGQDGTNSAVVTLHYVYALQNAARIFDWLDEPRQAAIYRQRADFIKKKVYETCYDARRGLLAERPTRDYFDQHTSIMAVLTDALPVAQQKPVLARILADTTLGQATYYYRYYLLEALHKAKAGDLIDLALQPWKKAVADGLTTTPERFESPNKPTRSECHPWSTAPAYAFFSTVAGIRPAEPGFRTIRMEPQLGALTSVEGAFPHPAGEMTFRLEKNGPTLAGFVTLPQGVRGTLVWAGKTIPLKAGRQTIRL